MTGGSSRRLFASLGLAVLAMMTVARPATAEKLVFEPSTRQVEITSNFSGTTLTVFGTIERDAASVGRSAGWELAVTLVGPNRTLVTRRKERTFGIWINREGRTYVAPSYYAVATTRPIVEMATPEALKVAQVGLDALILPESIPGGVEVMAGTPDFREAFLRLQRTAGHYAEYPGGIRRMGSTLWATTLPIPADVPVGPYRVRAILFADGVEIAEGETAIEVAKSGFESTVADLAAHRPVLYGIASVLIALLTGWLGGVLFRRD
jgi:uncharacterized protein (TIGR02186 family)